MLPTSPRLTASRANSFWLQWVIGRPLTEGGSQARATIAQTCSAVKVAGAPERGASARRPAVLSSSCPASQRPRQRRTVLASTPTLRAVSRTPSPSSASRMIQARTASCCGVRWPRQNRSSAVFCLGLKVMHRVERSAIASSGVNVLTPWTAFPALLVPPTRRGRLFRYAVLVVRGRRKIPWSRSRPRNRQGRRYGPRPSPVPSPRQQFPPKGYPLPASDR